MTTMTKTPPTPDLADVLHRIAAALERPTVPPDWALWDGASCAAYLSVSEFHFTRRIAAHPDFPAAIALPTKNGQRGTRRWKAAEVRAWAEKLKERKYK